MTHASLSRSQLIGLIVLTLMWGINWPVMKLSLRELGPLHFRALTMALGALGLLLFFRLQGIRMLPRGAAEWRQVVWLGLPNMLGWHALSIYGLAQLPAGRAAVLGFTMPVWTVALGVLFYGERLTARLLLAAAAVLAGITLLLWNELAQLAGQPAGIAWMQGAALCWALGTVWMRRTAITLPSETLVVWMMALAALAIAPLALALEPTLSWRFSPAVWASLVWAVLVNYGASQVIWFRLARVLPPSTSAMSIMAVPLIGVLSAPLIVGEWPQWQDLAAMTCVVVAIGAVLLPARGGRETA
ncbi:DMT family transporter [Ottowia sp.]|uniref:DMT family transporter n=1 Tax=Ottowia sp. TaxID=1898956 RepID=UPI002BF99B2A|nr:DMT family transporter [Ottowia sp.]HRN76127.1 DMT family transporter [Ottowia sp.]HRQ03459.1 DMT family transporter [Ottowia sp.]